MVDGGRRRPVQKRIGPPRRRLSRLEKARRRALDAAARSGADGDLVEAAPVEHGAGDRASTAPHPPDATAEAKLGAIRAVLVRDGPTRAVGLVALGVSRQHLADLASRGVLRRLRHGLYGLPG